jgi:hypothetical protein
MSLQNDLKLLFVRYNLVPASLLQWRLKRELKRWEQNSDQAFPHILKQKIVLESAAAAGARVFIETGTYYGLMLQACVRHFDRLYSIELEPHFYRRASVIFGRNSKVTLLHGDSADLLHALLQKIESSCLFWLDAHYSGGLTGQTKLETPIRSELEAIFNHPYKHVVLIDDAGCFDGTHDYPEIDWIIEKAESNGYRLAWDHNMIRLSPSAIKLTADAVNPLRLS